MKTLLCILALFTLLGCTSGLKNNEPKAASDSTIHYSNQQLIEFLDSIGTLPAQPLIDKVSFKSDSVFKDHQQLDRTLSATDFRKLKEAVKASEAELDCQTAINIFGPVDIDSAYIEKNSVPITFFSFDKNNTDFNEFAIQPAYGGFYFFKSNSVISKHTIYNRLGVELYHYKDGDGKTIIYYKANYVSGTGAWWTNFHFYKYYGNSLIPILNELENANLSFPWSFRAQWLQASVQGTDPLTIKMVYHQDFYDRVTNPRFVDDSTFVKYIWDEPSRSLIGEYEHSKISKPQIRSYYIEDNELLFVNAYYTTLKANLKNKALEQATLHYLNEVKNHFDAN